jgi:hypothetical protein
LGGLADLSRQISKAFAKISLAYSEQKTIQYGEIAP